jgi:hypothetical protein
MFGVFMIAPLDVPPSYQNSAEGDPRFDTPAKRGAVAPLSA